MQMFASPLESRKPTVLQLSDILVLDNDRFAAILQGGVGLYARKVPMRKE